MFVDWFKNVSAMFVYVYEIYATYFSAEFSVEFSFSWIFLVKL